MVFRVGHNKKWQQNSISLHISFRRHDHNRETFLPLYTVHINLKIFALLHENKIQPQMFLVTALLMQLFLAFHILHLAPNEFHFMNHNILQTYCSGMCKFFATVFETLITRDDNLEQ